jgi:hypothetical protein
MTALVLEVLYKAHPDLFASSAERVWEGQPATSTPLLAPQVSNDGIGDQPKAKEGNGGSGSSNSSRDATGDVTSDRLQKSCRGKGAQDVQDIIDQHNRGGFTGVLAGPIAPWHDGQLGGALAARPGTMAASSAAVIDPMARYREDLARYEAAKKEREQQQDQDQDQQEGDEAASNESQDSPAAATASAALATDGAAATDGSATAESGSSPSAGLMRLPPPRKAAVGGVGGGVPPVATTAMATAAPWAATSHPPATMAAPPSYCPLSNSSGSSGVGIRRVMAYMSECQPSAEDIEDGQRKWVAAQSASAPTLLPGLQFYDLVFGQELGIGSFSTVKYARQILKQQLSSSKGLKGRSVWPEFAVKIISRSKIAEFDYKKNVIREIAVLKTLSHPVSSQRQQSVASVCGVMPEQQRDAQRSTEFIHSSIHPFIHSSIHPFLRPYLHPSIHPSIRPCFDYSRAWLGW